MQLLRTVGWFLSPKLNSRYNAIRSLVFFVDGLSYQAQVAPSISIAKDTLDDPELCEHVAKMIAVVGEYPLECWPLLKNWQKSNHAF